MNFIWTTNFFLATLFTSSCCSALRGTFKDRREKRKQRATYKKLQSRHNKETDILAGPFIRRLNGRSRFKAYARLEELFDQDRICVLALPSEEDDLCFDFSGIQIEAPGAGVKWWKGNLAPIEDTTTDISKPWTYASLSLAKHPETGDIFGQVRGKHHTHSFFTVRGQLILESQSYTDYPEDDPSLMEQLNRQVEFELDALTGHHSHQHDQIHTTGDNRELTGEVDDGSIIDINMIYTRRAMCDQADQPYPCDAEFRGPIETRILDSVATTNSILSASNATFQIRLVDLALEEHYDEDNAGSHFYQTYIDLFYLFYYQYVDMTLGKLWERRQASSADVSVLITAESSPRFCGQARPYNGHSSAAWSSVHLLCLPLSLAHEVGHNLGAEHDPLSRIGINAPPFASGYLDPDGEFRTIMAYTAHCPVFGGCPRIELFSAPTMVGGKAIGSSNHDNVRRINQEAFTVANFSPSTYTYPPTTSPTTASPTITSSPTITAPPTTTAPPTSSLSPSVSLT